MRLRARLLLSYLVVIAVTLAVITTALFLFLLAQPARPESTYQQLSTMLRDLVEANRESFGGRPQIGTLATLPDRLSTFAADNQTRIMIVNIPNRTVVYDTAGEYARGDSLGFLPDTYALPLYLRRNMPAGAEPVVGRFQDAEGQEWLFSGVAAVRGGNENNAVIVAETAPPRDLQAVWEQFRGELALPLLQAGVVGVLIALVLAVFISRSIASSLQSLAEAAHEVARGNYAWRIPVKGSPEVRDVAQAFNRMSAEVHRTQQSQQDFLANVSHDLKTPLTSIQGYSQAIMDGTAKNPADAARIIHEESARLNRLVVELTDLAQLQAGHLSMSNVPIDIGLLAKSVGERLAVVAHKRGITLHIETSPMPEVLGDGDRLAQVLTNLVGNAVHFTPSGGEIWLRTRVSGGGVEVVVQDTGIGIAEPDLPRIFERFYQVDKTRGPRRGTGLGLAITQEIVTAHGGKISAASPGKGQGSTFTVWLPSIRLKPVGRKHDV